jgi:hypothetical protein
MKKIFEYFILSILFSVYSFSQTQNENLITIKILKVEQVASTSSLYIEADFTNKSHNHLDQFYLRTYIYNKDGEYLGRTINLINNLAPLKHTIKTIHFSNVQYNDIGKWEFVLEQVITIKEKNIKYHDDYTAKLIK